MSLLLQIFAQLKGLPESNGLLGPSSPFEGSSNFFPETYTTDARLPQSCLVVVRSFESESFGDFKTNRYETLYMKSPRQWCRLSIWIKINQHSTYWAATETSRQVHNTRETIILVGSAPLPYSLTTKLQMLLKEETLVEDSILHYSLTDKLTRTQNIGCQDSLSSECSRVSREHLKALAFLEDLGCRRFKESEVTQIELLDPPSRFASSVNGMLVFETKFARSEPSAELLYNIRVLHCMNGCPGFAKLVGIVVDDTVEHLKSYLIEFPKARWTLAGATEARSIPWKDREQWAKQLVSGVDQLHSLGFVVGTLGTSRAPVLDNSDSVLFWSFRERFSMGYRIGSLYPPEFLRFRNSSPTIHENQSARVTSKADIFHIGQLLWLLAENSPRTNNSPICIRERCNERGVCSKNSHIEPICLPRLPESIPQYYRDIIDACRAENPNDRPAARTLLEMFPPTDEPSSYPTAGLDHESTELSVLGKGLLGYVSCDNCRKPYLTLPIYHCNVCQIGDFDICQACYDLGAHCEDLEHYLVEMRKIGSWVVPGRYLSCVKSSGRRDVVEL